MSILFKKLVLGGGGMKGIMHIGALQELKKYQDLIFPDGVWGCSIGSILGILIAFKLDLKTELISKYMDFDNLVGDIKFQDVQNIFGAKGLFSMEKFTNTLTTFFKEEYELDITTTKIGDSKMPLFIVASNITKGIPTIFSNDVLLIDAIRCSCCIPLVYKPQELYGQLYVDGGLFVPYLCTIVPDGLHFVLTKKRTKRFGVDTLETISPLDYMRSLYSMSMNQFYKFYKSEYSLELEYPKLFSDSSLDEFDIDDILNHSGKLLRSFLISKGFLKELAEVDHIRLTDHLV
jgi:NTE family protein